VGPIDLSALRHERERRRGHHLLAHLRSEAYAAYAQPLYPTGQAAGRSMTPAVNDAATQVAKSRLRDLML
jgi:hypothetical protein